MKTLIMMMGLPRSGKTTIARQLSKKFGWPIVNPDSVRLAFHGQRFISKLEPEVWIRTQDMVEALFLSGHNVVILDSTNISYERRKLWYGSGYKVRIYEIETLAKECLIRAESKDDFEIMPIIKKMAKDYTPLDTNEERFIEREYDEQL